MKQFFIYFLIILIFISIGWFGHVAFQLYQDSHLAGVKASPKPTPLAKYSIENLSNTEFKPSEIKIEDKNLFSFMVDSKKVTGRITIPEGKGPFPLIVMFRGYVDPEIYYTGLGTKNAADYFTKNGYITIAPDFLGYAGSDIEASDVFESRFQTYTTAITLLKSLDHKNIQPFNYSQVFIWGHSNGGQVALTALEATGVNYPTVLWAPVTKIFPYSILYFTDEADDHGKFLRKELAKFEEAYDVEKFTLVNYLDKIKAPIQLHQGTNDDAVPYKWNDEFTKKLKGLKINVDYIKYIGADHNLNPNWNEASQTSLEFFNKYLK